MALEYRPDFSLQYLGELMELFVVSHAVLFSGIWQAAVSGISFGMSAGQSRVRTKRSDKLPSGQFLDVSHVEQRLPQRKKVIIDVGTFLIDIYDTAAKRLVWTGSASKTLDANSSNEGRQKSVDKAAKKLLANYPPAVSHGVTSLTRVVEICID